MTYQAGISAFKSGDYQSALNELHQATEEDDQNHKAWNALGVVLTKTGDFETADTCYQNALTLAPDTPVYQRNRDKNRVKWQEGEVLEVEEDTGVRIPKGPIKTGEPDVGDRFSNKFAIILSVIGFFFGVVTASLTLVLGGFGSVLGVTGAESLITRSWVVILLSFIGVLASVVRHKQYAFLILVLVGFFEIILLSVGGIIPGALFIIAGYLIFRKIKFDLHYYFDFKSDIAKKAIFSLVMLFCFIIFISALASVGGDTEKSKTPQIAMSSGNNNQNYDFSGVTHASVTIMEKNWNSDAKNDGIVIYPNLLDVSDQTIKWIGATLPVSVKIWSKKTDSNYNSVPDRLLFTGNGEISDWKDGNFLLGNGIRVPFDQISKQGDEKYGITLVTITLPDGRTMEAKDTVTSLIPSS
jgi:hypothetical protein